MAINSGQRPRAQLWSRAIYAAYPDVQGLLYASSTKARKALSMIVPVTTAWKGVAVGEC